MSTTEAEQSSQSDPTELKQSLDEELSQLVHEYTTRGLDTDEIVDSIIWHAEVAETASDAGMPLDLYIDDS